MKQKIPHYIESTEKVEEVLYYILKICIQSRNLYADKINPLRINKKYEKQQFKGQGPFFFIVDKW